MRVFALTVVTFYGVVALGSVRATELPQKEDAFTMVETIGLFGACLVLMKEKTETMDKLAAALDSVTFRADALYRAKWTTSLFDASRTFFGREPSEFVPIVAKSLAKDPHDKQQSICDGTFLVVKSWFPSSSPEALVKRWLEENNTCRGSSGPASLKACEQREKTSKTLSSLGWCYGKNGQVMADMWWHRCGPDSLR